MTEKTNNPSGSLAIRTMAMPKDTNASGAIFGGWLMSQMDVAGGITAARRAAGRVVTVSVSAMEFHKPVSVGDVLSCYGEIEAVGTTSIRVRVEAWVEHRLRQAGVESFMATQGTFTFVALDENGKKRPVPPA